MDYKNFTKNLIEKIPEFKEIFQNHLNSNGEVIPNVLMGEFTRFYLNLVQSKNVGLISKSNDLLEEFLNSNDIELQNLVYVSFLENLNRDKNLDEVKKFLSPKLLKALEIII